MEGTIVVQGGTMHNDAIVRAFELETGKTVIRSNLPELMGAYGCALQAASQKSNSRTINQLLETTGYTSRQIQCNGCENKCFVCRYTFPNGNTFFSGNKCERIFTNRGESEKPGQNIYTDKYALLFDREIPETGNKTIGIPRVLNMYENYPFGMLSLLAAVFGSYCPIFQLSSVMRKLSTRSCRTTSVSRPN